MNSEPPVWLRRTLLALAVLPIVFAVVRALNNGWFPIGDNALLYLRAADVLTHHHPLLGSWTSASQSVGVNMNNPGPLYADLIAPFAKVFSPGPGAALGVGALNILTVFGISAASKRVGDWAFQRWALLAAVALGWSMGSELLIDIWQSHAMMLPFLLVLILLVGVASGQSSLLPWAIGLVSLIVQTHISHAYILAAMCIVATVSYVVARNARPHRPCPQVFASGAAFKIYILLAVLWGQTVYEQFFGDGKGNFSRLVGNASGGSLHVGAESALGITANLFALPTWWSRFDFTSAAPITLLTGPPDDPQLNIAELPNVGLAVASLIAVILLLAVLLVYSRRQQRYVHANACLIALAAVVSSVLAVSQLTVGPVGFSSHHVRFLWPTAAFVHVVLAWSAVDWLGNRWQATKVAPWAVAVATVAFAVATLPYHAQPAGPVADYSAMPALRRVLPELHRLRDVQPVLYDVSNVRVFEPYSATVMMQLNELGIEFRVEDEGMIRQLGESRRADGSEPARIFQLQGAPALLYAGPACLIGIASGLTSAAESSASELAEQLAVDLAEGQISVNHDATNDDETEPSRMLEAAVNGEQGAARWIVYEGYLSAWFANDEVSAGRDLTETFTVINNYITSVYALFSEQSRPCG